MTRQNALAGLNDAVRQPDTRDRAEEGFDMRGARGRMGLRDKETLAMKRLLISLAAMFCVVSAAQVQLLPTLKISIDKDQKTQVDIRQKATVKTSGDVAYHSPEVADSARDVVLTIHVQNMVPAGLAGLTIRYAVLGKDIKTQKAALAVQGKSLIDLPGLQTQDIQTDPAHFESEEVQFKTGEFTERNRKTGQRYYGVAVLVYQGDRRLAAYYEPDSVEQAAANLNITF